MNIMLSPVAFAGWAGMFVTMINLLPGGQLDGGHVAFALFGPRQNRIAQWVHRSMLAFFFVSVASFVARDVRGGLRRCGTWASTSSNSHVLAASGSRCWPSSARSSRARGRATGSASARASWRRSASALLAGLFHDRTAPLPWIAWFVGLGVLLAMEVRWGALRRESTLLDHPPTGAQPLRPGARPIAVLTLAFFVLLFMPTPFAF